MCLRITCARFAVQAWLLRRLLPACADTAAACRHPFLAVDADREAFLGFALKVLLYQPPASLLRAAPAMPLDAPAAGVSRASRWLHEQGH